MKTADEIRGMLAEADKLVLLARVELNARGAFKLAGECSAVSIILGELFRPGVIDCDEEEVNPEYLAHRIDRLTARVAVLRGEVQEARA